MSEIKNLAASSLIFILESIKTGSRARKLVLLHKDALEHMNVFRVKAAVESLGKLKAITFLLVRFIEFFLSIVVKEILLLF